MDGCMRSGQRLANHPSEWRSKVFEEERNTKTTRARRGTRALLPLPSLHNAPRFHVSDKAQSPVPASMTSSSAAAAARVVGGLIEGEASVGGRST